MEARASLLDSIERATRLASGLVLFTYVAMHLANHALGLVSIDVAERALALAVTVWRSGPGTLLLYGAAGVHFALALVGIHRRPLRARSPADLLRVAMGFGIPLLLIGHVASTRIAWELYGRAADYHRVVAMLWMSRGQGRQLALLVPGWAHGCIGVHFACQGTRTYRRWRGVLWALALLLPLLGALGFFAMGASIAGVDLGVPAATSDAAARAQDAWLAHLHDWLLAGYLGSVSVAIIYSLACRHVGAQGESESKVANTICGAAGRRQ